VIYNRKNNGKWVGRDERTSARGTRGASTARLLVGHVLSLYFTTTGVAGPRPNRVVINYQSNYLMI